MRSLALSAVPTLLALAACTFHPPSGGSGEPSSIVDDSAADFGASDELVGAVVAKRGAIEPRAYSPLGLHARAFKGVHVDGATTWDGLTSQVLGPSTGSRYAMSLDESNNAAFRPLGMGITLASASQFTVLYDGEIFLPAGTTNLLFFADDNGFLQFQLAGGIWTPELRNDFTIKSGTQGSVTVDSEGWYPIRGAYAQGGGDRYFKLQAFDPITNNPAPFPTANLRAEVTASVGAIVRQSNNRILTLPVDASSVELDALNHTFASGVASYDLSDAFNTYSLRYAGQLLIEADDVYKLSASIGVDPGDYYRIFLDSQLVASSWPSLEMKPASDALMLKAGWHDLVVDYADKDNAATIVVLLERASNGAIPITAAQLRPAMPRGAFVAAAASNLSVGAGTTLTESLPLLVPSGSTIDSIDYGFVFGSAVRDGNTTTVSIPAGSIAYDIPAIPNYEGIVDYTAVRSELAGQIIDDVTMWQLGVTTNATASATVSSPQAVASYHGGDHPPFAPVFAYTSGKRGVPEGITITNVHVDASLHDADGNDAAMVISLRSGSAGEIDSLPWTPVTPDAPVSLQGGELVQYLIEISGDGWSVPSVERVEIDFE